MPRMFASTAWGWLLATCRQLCGQRPLGDQRVPGCSALVPALEHLAARSPAPNMCVASTRSVRPGARPVPLWLAFCLSHLFPPFPRAPAFGHGATFAPARSPVMLYITNFTEPSLKIVASRVPLLVTLGAACSIREKVDRGVAQGAGCSQQSARSPPTARWTGNLKFWWPPGHRHRSPVRFPSSTAAGCRRDDRGTESSIPFLTLVRSGRSRCCNCFSCGGGGAWHEGWKSTMGLHLGEQFSVLGAWLVGALVVAHHVPHGGIRLNRFKSW